MSAMAMRNIITLLQIEEGYGHGRGNKIVNSMVVWGKAEDISTTSKVSALSAGIQADLVVHLWKREFKKYPFTHIVVDNVRYKIISTGTSMNNLLVKLTVMRC